MQSTEEYLDQLLASVSDEESNKDLNVKSNTTAHKSIEDLDESELTEEALQKQLALLLGLETEEDMDFNDEPEDDFLSQYTAQVAAVETESFDAQMQVLEEEIMPETKQEPAVEVPVAVEEVLPEPVVSEVSATTTSDSGVLSADEIAALFAAMEAENQAEESEPVVMESEPVVAEPESVIEESEPEVPTTSLPATSDSGVLSPDEIAALFATMGADDAENEVSYEEQPVQDATGGLTREELEELGLGDIADVLVDGEQEILAESVTDNAENKTDVGTEDADGRDAKTESSIVEIPDFDFGEEMLLELENVDAMLEATAKMAEEEETALDADSMAEEDIMAMLNQFEEESALESMAAQEESVKAAEEAVNKALEEPVNEEPEENDKKKRKKEKKEKVKKEKPVKEKKVKEKRDKVSLKDKIFAFMFEDENLEDEKSDGEKVPLGDGDELAYMDLPMPEVPEKKKKEKAPKKDKKAKKAAAGKAKDENAEIAAELAAEDKKKAQKKEKPKKEKKAKKVVIADISADDSSSKDAKKGIGVKGIVATLLVCASVLGLILVGTYFLPKQLSLMAARTAFYAQDYEETTLRLMGRKLNASDRILYDKASLLYGLEERYHQSEIYLENGMSKEALDSLLQGVATSNEEEALAVQLGIETEWRVGKERFVQALQDNYGLDVDTIETVCALRNPDYTIAVENILAGRMYDDKSAYGGTASDVVAPDAAETEENTEDGNDENLPDGLNPDEMEDLLPEEEAILEQMQQEAFEAEEISESDAEVTGDNELYSGSVEGGEVNFVE